MRIPTAATAAPYKLYQLTVAGGLSMLIGTTLLDILAGSAMPTPREPSVLNNEVDQRQVARRKVFGRFSERAVDS